MRAADLFSLSTRMFRTRPTRTGLTILGISVGISAVLFLVALGYGLQRVILQKIIFNQALLSLTVTPANELVVFNDLARQQLKRLPKVEDVAMQATYNGQAILDDLHGSIDLRAVDARFFDYAGVTAIAGKVFDESETNEAVVSEAVLKLFGVENTADILGKPLRLQVIVKAEAGSTSTPEAVTLPRRFTVKGVVEDAQDSYIYIPLKELTKFVTVTRYDQARIKVVASEDIAGVKEAVINKGYQVASLSETIDQANKIFQVVQIVLGLFGAVALVVSSIGMFNTMTVTLLERTNEIGIMRAIGASRPNLRNLFLAESLFIGLLGGVVGEALGLSFAALANYSVNSLAAHFGGAQTDLFYFPPWFLIGTILLSMTIGLFAGIFPARRAANLEPLEALRYK